MVSQLSATKMLIDRATRRPDRLLLTVFMMRPEDFNASLHISTAKRSAYQLQPIDMIDHHRCPLNKKLFQ